MTWDEELSRVAEIKEAKDGGYIIDNAVKNILHQFSTEINRIRKVWKERGDQLSDYDLTPETAYSELMKKLPVELDKKMKLYKKLK